MANIRITLYHSLGHYFSGTFGIGDNLSVPHCLLIDERMLNQEIDAETIKRNPKIKKI